MKAHTVLGSSIPIPIVGQQMEPGEGETLDKNSTTDLGGKAPDDNAVVLLVCWR